MPTAAKVLSLSLAVLLVILLVFASGPFVIVTFFIATILVASLINISKIRVIGIEFATFIGVITAIAYGPLTGAVIGAVLISVHMVAANYIGPYIAWVVPSYAIGAYVAGIIGAGNIVVTGLYVTLVINGISLFFTAAIYRQNIGAYMPYMLTNIAINFFLFSAFGGGALTMLRA